jgi:hypothetical protein
MLARTPPQSGRIYFFAMERTFIDRLASESDHRRAKETAQAALDGRTTVLEAVRALVSLAHADAVADVEDRKFIIGIESETDHLPVGEVRKLWASSALKEKDVEIGVPRNRTGLISWKRAEGSCNRIAPSMSEIEMFRQSDVGLGESTHSCCGYRKLRPS